MDQVLFIHHQPDMTIPEQQITAPERRATPLAGLLPIRTEAVIEPVERVAGLHIAVPWQGTTRGGKGTLHQRRAIQPQRRAPTAKVGRVQEHCRHRHRVVCGGICRQQMAGEDPLIRADTAEIFSLFLDPDFAAHGQRCGNGAVQVGGRVDEAA
ncbi:MAG: Uncharacterised protein [Rhodospirillaceae bacterium]|nr:MAG: Uncharacterised protein [Rhodospirillaceae bacterium]